MLKLTKKGKELVAKNGGVLKVQAIESGYFDYSEYSDWDSIFEAWAKEVGGWDFYEGDPKEDDEESVYTAEESKARLESEFSDAMFEAKVEELIEDGDTYGIGVKLGYLEEADEEVDDMKKFYVMAVRTNLDGYPEQFTVSWDNGATDDYDEIRFFDTKEEAERWTASDEAKQWKDCTFEIVEDADA